MKKQNQESAENLGTVKDDAPSGQELDDVVQRAVARALIDRLGGMTYGILLPLTTGNVPMAAIDALQDIVRGADPRDPLERMLVEQLAFCHLRIQHWTVTAVKTTDVNVGMAANEQCDRAMNTYRRGMLALKEYRTRRSTPPTFAVAVGRKPDGNGNADRWRVDPPRKKMTNELGANHGNGASNRRQPGKSETLARPHAGGNGAAAHGRDTQQALASIDWA